MKLPGTNWHVTANRSPNGGLWYGYALDVSKQSPQERKEWLDFFHKNGISSIHLHHIENRLQCAEIGQTVIQIVGGSKNSEIRTFEKWLQQLNICLPDDRFDSLLDIYNKTHWIPTNWTMENGSVKQGFRLSVKDVSSQKKQQIINFLNTADIHFIERKVTRPTDTLVGGEIAIAVMDPESVKRLQRVWDIAGWNKQKCNIDTDYDIANETDVFRGPKLPSTSRTGKGSH